MTAVDTPVALVGAPYPKINGLYKRDEHGRILVGEWACEEFDYLASLEWVWHEKVDGTNIRLSWQPGDHQTTAAPDHRIGGRTDRAQIHADLRRRLMDIHYEARWDYAFGELAGDNLVTVYGEGYGAGINNGGRYAPDGGVGFIAFDVKVGDCWLGRHAARAAVAKLGLDFVPFVGRASIADAEALVRDGTLVSRWPRVHPEGLVGRPSVELRDRWGQRVLTKIKYRDYWGNRPRSET